MSTFSGSEAMSPQEQAHHLREMMRGFCMTQMLYVAAKLGLADLLSDGPKSTDELATATDANADALYRVLRALASFGIFEETTERRFGLTPMATLLQEKHPYSVRPHALFHGEDAYRSWSDLLYTVRTGKTAFDHVFGMGHFAYLAQHPEASAIFNQMMSANAQRGVSVAAAVYDFTAASTVVDVGGGHGTLISAVLQANPGLRGILFDEAYVVADALPMLESAGVADRCERVGGDFFGSLPPGADIYMMRHIIHDWDDKHSTAILRNCAEAMASDGRVLVIESVVEPGNAPSPTKFLDMQMLVMSGGRERTAEEYRRLFAAAGLTLTRIVPAGSESLLEGVRAEAEKF